MIPDLFSSRFEKQRFEKRAGIDTHRIASNGGGIVDFLGDISKKNQQILHSCPFISNGGPARDKEDRCLSSIPPDFSPISNCQLRDLQVAGQTVAIKAVRYLKPHMAAYLVPPADVMEA